MSRVCQARGTRADLELDDFASADTPSPANGVSALAVTCLADGPSLFASLTHPTSSPSRRSTGERELILPIYEILKNEK